MENVITLEIPNHRLADPNKFTHPDPTKQPEVGTLRDEYVDFGIVRLAPDTIVGKEKHVVTTHQKFLEYCQFTGRDFIDWCKELTVVHGCRFQNLMFFIKLSNEEYLSQVPQGILGDTGTGETGDADVGVLRTWQQWNKFAQHLGEKEQPHYSNSTHKFLACWTYAGLPLIGVSEYAAFFNRIDIVNDSTKYDIISIWELQEQQQLDLQQ